MTTATSHLPVPEFFRRFVEYHWPQKSNRWDQLVDEMIRAAADGIGCTYTRETVANLMQSRDDGYSPEECGYYGEPK